MSLTGCASNRQFATLTGGACSAFPAPTVQIKGRTSMDQRWADETTEAGVAGCGWKRPARRPASLDARPRAAAPALETVAPAPAAAPPAKRNFWHWFRRRPPANTQGG
jgi:hypothetical protein